MQRLDLPSFLGRRCRLIVQCGACGRSHVREGTVSIPRAPGEIAINGQAYPLRDVRTLVALPDADRREAEIPRSVFDLALLGGLALALCSVARLWI